ncbi:hypothetical protein CDAR_98601 [Caerostris darwini]|uniref:Uncharacterized protein n=1 Tax=Caerostris darwini TaxID=1538125 RepID=A0AAV4UFS3_9ARAC|nr:hypothetical protein CDAR_98601 [Caerostris darwini]
MYKLFFQQDPQHFPVEVKPMKRPPTHIHSTVKSHKSSINWQNFLAPPQHLFLPYLPETSPFATKGCPLGRLAMSTPLTNRADEGTKGSFLRTCHSPLGVFLQRDALTSPQCEFRKF